VQVVVHVLAIELAGDALMDVQTVETDIWRALVLPTSVTVLSDISSWCPWRSRKGAAKSDAVGPKSAAHAMHRAQANETKENTKTPVFTGVL
jgi:hypothetical protein